MKKVVSIVLVGIILCALTACNIVDKQVELGVVPVTETDVLRLSDNSNALSLNEKEEVELKTIEASEIKEKVVTSLLPDIKEIFYTPSVVVCEYEGNFQGVDIGFTCKYTISEKDNGYTWDIEDISCTKYNNENVSLDVMSYINKVMSTTSFRANTYGNNIKYIVYDDTIATNHDVDNSVNDLNGILLTKFGKEKAGVYLDYNADEGVYYREAYKFVECFLRAIVGDLPFQINIIANKCYLTKDEQTNTKQIYTNGNIYTVEKVDDAIYEIGVEQYEVNYCVKLTIYK